MLLSSLSLRNYKGFRSSVPETGDIDQIYISSYVIVTVKRVENTQKFRHTYAFRSSQSNN